MATSTQLYANNARSTLATGITNLSTSITLASGEGALFPSPATNQYFLITLETGSTREIIKISSRSGDVLTVAGGVAGRGQEGTTANSWSSGSLVEMRITKNTLAAFARLQDRMYEVNSLDLLSAPIDSDGNTYIAHDQDDQGNSIIAIRESDYRWSFPTYSTNIVTGTVTAGTNNTLTVTSTNIGSLPTFATGRFIIQFLTATNASIKGLPRRITASGTNTVTWSPALPASVTVGDTFRIYMSDVGVFASPVFASLTVSGLGTSRVVYTTTGGTLTSTGNLTYDGTDFVQTGGTHNLYGTTTSVKDTVFQIKGTADATKIVVFSASALSTATTRTFTLPDVSDTLVTLSATQSLTNKTIAGATITGSVTDSANTTKSGTMDAYGATVTFKDSAFTIKNSGDSSKVIIFSAANISPSGTRTYTMPDASGTVVLLNSGGLVDPSQGGVPTGTVLPFAGPTAPTGFLLCDGSAVSRTTYSALFGIISTTHGAGNGSTTFNVPDYRGRSLFGKDDMGGVAANRVTSAGSGVNGAGLGATGGAETVTLSLGQMPQHAHTLNETPHNHPVTNGLHGHGVTDPTHNHVLHDPSHYHRGSSSRNLFYNGGGGRADDAPGGGLDFNGASSQIWTVEGSVTGIWIDAVSTGISVNNGASNVSLTAASTGITINNNGSSQAHNNMPPASICNFIIKI
jgi:microcystin-dependent protein